MRIGDFDPIFGKNVRYLRSLCHMSQRTLAVLVGTSVHYIRKIEDAEGQVGLDFRIFDRICAVFHSTSNDITRVDLAEQKFVFPIYANHHWKPVEEYIYPDAEKLG